MHFDAEQLPALYRDHLARLDRLVGDALEERELDALVISAGGLKPRSPFDDQDWPFRPTPAFTHWLPLREPGNALVIRPGATPRLIRATQAGFWDAPPRVDSHHVWSSFEVCETPVDDVKAYLPSTRRCAFIGDDPARARGWEFDDALINPPELIASLHAIRARKSEYEVECMRRANRVAARGHARIAERFASSEASELALHLLYLEATEQDDPDTPYKNIVAIAENAATLHHVAYDRAPRSGAESSLLVDAGATYLGYASDITRTWVKGVSPAAETFGELVRRMDELQRRIAAEIAPGMAYEDLHDRTHELLAEVLRDLDIVRASPAAIVDSGASRVFFPHGLGHSLGIQVHDVGLRPRDPRPENRFLRNTGVIELGQVFTLEPGCYFIGSLLHELRGRSIAADVSWSLVDSLRPFGGVRVEDNVAVTEAGTENLTRPALDEALSAARDAP
jgi:Xaa-Pro dipeptidase